LVYLTGDPILLAIAKYCFANYSSIVNMQLFSYLPTDIYITTSYYTFVLFLFK